MSISYFHSDNSVNNRQSSKSVVNIHSLRVALGSRLFNLGPWAPLGSGRAWSLSTHEHAGPVLQAQRSRGGDRTSHARACMRRAPGCEWASTVRFGNCQIAALAATSPVAVELYRRRHSKT
jgi:hypothetical protein